jgi:Tol biopolymer transport system component
MAKKSTKRVEPTGARFNLRHRPSAGLAAALLALGVCSLSFAPPAVAVDLISVGTMGFSGNGASSGVSLNADGSVVAFFSDANDLVINDTNNVRDVFVRDRNTNATERVSVSSTGEQANGPSQRTGMAPPISDDGHIVAFYSLASNLVPDDNNSASDVFVRDRVAPTTELVSVNEGGNSGNGASRFPSMSADGRFVAFESDATDLVDGDTNGKTDIFVRDRQAGTTELLCFPKVITDGTFGVRPNAASTSAAISADGNFVAFVSAATNLVSAQTGGRKNVYVCDRTTNTIELISATAAGVPGNEDSMAPAISGDGNVVVFKSDADNLVPGDMNDHTDIFAVDRAAGTIERISVDPSGGNANAGSFLPTVSRNGQFVVFGSDASNLVSGDVNQVADVFVRDRTHHVTLMVDLTSTGAQANGGVPDSGAIPAISANSQQIGFVSLASNLAGIDQNGQADVFATVNPFVCGDGGTCSAGMVCSAGFCQPNSFPTVTATATNTATPTPTRTPTPPIPCFVNTDCPKGQVCDPTQKVCEPAPTPTPKTPCTDDTNCPSDQKCVAGFCQLRVTPTPTITPTPLPTCTTDADCAPEPDGTPTHCRAGVCVPIRPCDDTNQVIDRLNCRGDRETCVNDTCECLGDCNTDGFVLANEIANMVCLLSNQNNPTDLSPCASSCAAGYLNIPSGIGITGSQICTAVQNLQYGCPAEGQALVTGQAAAETRSLDIGSASGAPGTVVTIGVNLSGGGNVATAQMDLLIDSRVLEVPADASTACAIDPRLIATDAAFNSLPQTPSTPPGMARIRLFVADFMLCQNNEPLMTAFDSGPMFSCQFRINPLATPGTVSPLTAERVNIGDNLGTEYVEGFNPGSVTVLPPSPCNTDHDCDVADGGGTHCRAGLCKGIRNCSGPTAGPTDCLNNREACIMENGAGAPGVCECGGDCNLDGLVRSNEITTLTNVFIGVAPVSACPADDINGDTIVRSNEVTAVTINFVQGCQ